MDFLKNTIEKNLSVWQECLDTDFVQGIGNGKLPKDDFIYYIVQDSIYLRKYAQVLATGIVKADNMADIRTLYSFLSFVNESEGSTRLKYLADAQITDLQADRAAENPVNKAYTDFMMQCATQGQLAEILMCALPCMLSYYWIFVKLVQQYPDSMNGYYGPFLKDYTDKNYHIACQNWTAYTENLCKDYSTERKEKLAEIFYESCIHELNFWNMKK